MITEKQILQALSRDRFNVIPLSKGDLISLNLKELTDLVNAFQTDEKGFTAYGKKEDWE